MRFYITVLVLCIITFPAAAELSLKQQREITDINRIKPLQNPRYQQAEKVLKRKILDSAHKVAGSLEDILIAQENGSVTSLLVTFDQVRLTQSVYLNYASLDISSLSTGYGLAFRSDRIEEIYPQLLDNIETAAGGNGMLSVRSIIGRRVLTKGGKSIGQVADILFNDQATQAMQLYLNITSGTLRNEGIAIPFDAVSYIDKDGMAAVQIDNDLGDYIIDYIRQR